MISKESDRLSTSLKGKSRSLIKISLETICKPISRNGIRLKKKGKKVFLFIQKIEKANLPQKVLLGFLGSILRWRHEGGVYDPELWSQRLARRTRTELLAWGASGSAKTRTHIAPQRKATRKKKIIWNKIYKSLQKSIKS